MFSTDRLRLALDDWVLMQCQAARCRERGMPVLGRLYLTTERLLFFDEVPGLPMMALSGMLLAAILPGTRRIDVTLKDISVVRILQTFPKNVWGRRRQARSLVIEGPGMYYELRVNVDRWLPALLDELGRPEDHVVLIMKGDEWRFIS